MGKVSIRNHAGRYRKNQVFAKNSRAVIDGKHAGRNLLHFVRKYNTKRKIYTMRDPYIFVGRLCSYDEAGKPCCKAEY